MHDHIIVDISLYPLADRNTTVCSNDLYSQILIRGVPIKYHKLHSAELPEVSKVPHELPFIYHAAKGKYECGKVSRTAVHSLRNYELQICTRNV